MATNDLSTLPGTTRIAFLSVNPKKPNTATHARYAASIGTTTLAQLRAIPTASTDEDIYFGVTRRYISVEHLRIPQLIVDNRARCPSCNFVYTKVGPRRPTPVWACGHRVCHLCQSQRGTVCFDRHTRETCQFCFSPASCSRLNVWQ